MLFLEKLKRDHLNKVYAANGMSFYDHLQGSSTTRIIWGKSYCW